jgi:hypothetical protein
MLICEDEVAAKEIYAAESLSRYIASMFYVTVHRRPVTPVGASLLAIHSDSAQGGDFTARRGIREPARSYRAFFGVEHVTDPIQTDAGERLR